MVFLDTVKEEVLDNSYENTVVLLNDISKNDFDVIKKNNENFNLKKEIKKYKDIDYNLIAELNGEYGLVKEKIDDFWFRLNNYL